MVQPASSCNCLLVMIDRAMPWFDAKTHEASPDFSRWADLHPGRRARRRWNTDRVLVDDRGDEVVIRPLANDPIAAARGSLKARAIDEGLSSADAREADP